MMGTLTQRVLEGLQERRRRIQEGKINCIPSPFPRFSDDFIGIEQHCYFLITSVTKGGKSQFGAYTFIFHPLLYAMANPDKVRVKILYFNLEETQERIVERFMSYYLYKTKGIRYSPSQLRSSKYLLPKDVLDLFYTEYADVMKFFEDNVIFSNTGNPYGIYRESRDYVESRGTVHYKTYTKNNDFGIPETFNQFDYYTPNDPDEYVIIFIDHIGIIDTEKGMTLKQSIDKLSEYLSKYLRNRYHCTPVVIQQQNFEVEGITARINNQDDVAVSSLGDSKYTSRDANVTLTLSAPFRTKKAIAEGYDITKFRDNIRFLKVGLNRDGEVGGICPLFFDGAVCNFEELPLPSDKEGIARYYARLDEMRGIRNNNPALINHIINKYKKLFIYG